MARINHSVSEYPDFVIDEIVARCGDDMHGAVKALLLNNEHLETELSRLRRASACGMRAARCPSFSLH